MGFTRLMIPLFRLQETVSGEYPQINQAHAGQPYQWAYAVLNPYSAGSAIVKVNVNDPSGASNNHFRSAWMCRWGPSFLKGSLYM